MVLLGEWTKLSVGTRICWNNVAAFCSTGQISTIFDGGLAARGSNLGDVTCVTSGNTDHVHCDLAATMQDCALTVLSLTSYNHPVVCRLCTLIQLK